MAICLDLLSGGFGQLNYEETFLRNVLGLSSFLEKLNYNRGVSLWHLHIIFLVLCIHSAYKQRQTNEDGGHFDSATDQNMPNQVVLTDVSLLKNP